MMFNVVGCDLECPECGVYGPHRFDGEETACLTCGTPREVEPELIASVLDMKFCDWCRETLPSNHTCRIEEPACESRIHLVRCGACPSCLALARLQIAPPVVAMADCPWCNAMRPVGHDCPAGAVGCTAGREDGTTCGECGPCLDAQRSDPRYGSQPDIDIP